MAKEYIEREAALNAILGQLPELHYPEWYYRDIKEIPAADVTEVVHGEWVQNPYCKRIFYCSECGRTVEDGSYNPNPSEHFPYCHCGAKMYKENLDG